MAGDSVLKLQAEVEACRARIIEQDALLLENDKLLEDRSSLLLDKKKLIEERDSLLLVNNKFADERAVFLRDKDRLVKVEGDLDGCRIKLDEQNKMLLDKDNAISELQGNLDYMKEQLSGSVNTGMDREKEIDYLKEEVAKYRDARKVEMTNKMKEYVYLKWEAAKTTLVSNYEAALKGLEEEVVSLRAENEALKTQIHNPSTTQLFEDPNTIARLDAVEELHREKVRNVILEQTCANLVGKLDLLAEVENFTAEDEDFTGAKQDTPCGKQLAKKDPESPNTMVKKVKERTANDDRLKKVFSPGPNTNEILELDGDFTTEVVHSGTPAVFKWDRKFYAVKNSTEHIKNYIKELFDDHGPAHVIWSGKPDYSRVIVMDVLAILHNERLQSPVIDSWANLLHVVSREKLGTCGAKVFSSQCWDLISKPADYTSATLNTFVYSVIDEVQHEDVLLFPLLVKESRRTGDHWTLLVLDLVKCEWLFLNPLRSRSSDPHLALSFVVVDFIEQELRKRFKESKPDHILLKGPLKKPKSNLYLQQKTGTLDCGVVVCIHIENFILKKDIEEGKLTSKDAGAYRKKMVEWFCEPIEITLD